MKFLILYLWFIQPNLLCNNATCTLIVMMTKVRCMWIIKYSVTYKYYKHIVLSWSSLLGWKYHAYCRFRGILVTQLTSIMETEALTEMHFLREKTNYSNTSETSHSLPMYRKIESLLVINQHYNIPLNASFFLFRLVLHEVFYNRLMIIAVVTFKTLGNI